MQTIRPNRVFTSNEAIVEKDCVDGFSTFGIKILQPEVGAWVEVSVRGRVFEPRYQPSDAPIVQMDTSLGNLLTEGTLIDLGGVVLVFHSPITMAEAPKVH